MRRGGHPSRRSSQRLCLPLSPAFLGPRGHLSQSREADLVTWLSPAPVSLGKMSHFSSPRCLSLSGGRPGGRSSAPGPLQEASALRSAVAGGGQPHRVGRNPQLRWSPGSPWAEPCWTQKAGVPLPFLCPPTALGGADPSTPHPSETQVKKVHEGRWQGALLPCPVSSPKSCGVCSHPQSLGQPVAGCCYFEDLEIGFSEGGRRSDGFPQLVTCAKPGGG